MIAPAVGPPPTSLPVSSPEVYRVRCMQSAMRRTEDRTPMRVAVDLSSLDVHMKAQQGVTENVSVRGARVLTSKPWRPNDHVIVRSLLGSLQSRARVVYCQRIGTSSFAVGLELFVTAGKWTLAEGDKKGRA